LGERASQRWLALLAIFCEFALRDDGQLGAGIQDENETLQAEAMLELSPQLGRQHRGAGTSREGIARSERKLCHLKFHIVEHVYERTLG
jgi:hypothetical protein